MFDSLRANLILYFSVLTIFLVYGPERIFNEHWNSDITIHTPAGVVRGDLDNGYVSFYGIPYAKPPLGVLRFKKPEPADPWEEVLNTAGRKKLPPCPQIYHSLFSEDIIGSEDCLYLNVFIPESTSVLFGPHEHDQRKRTKGLLPVMVWIHGGNFIIGSASSMDPHFLMTKDVIVVTISYRLGPLGSLNLHKSYAPGNQAFHDQILALKWIKTNIKSFGGNDEKITIFGESSGGRSVFNLLSTPKSKGLFHSAIIQSGTTKFLPSFPPNQLLQVHKNWTTYVGCNDVYNKEDCLQSLSLETILGSVSFADKCNTRYRHSPFPNPWSASIDKDLFIESPSDPKYVLPHDIPIMIGTNSADGVVISGKFNFENKESKSFLKNWNKCLGVITFGSSGPRYHDQMAEIERFYFNSESFNSKSHHINNLTNLVTDFWFYGPTSHLVKEIFRSKESPVYNYLFAHDGFVSYSDIWKRSQSEYYLFILKYIFGLDSGNSGEGACHADDVYYLFRNYPLNLLMRNVDVKMVELMVELWTNFAHVGDPNGNQNYGWKPASEKNDFEYVVLKNAMVSPPDNATRKSLKKRYKFWELMMRKQISNQTERKITFI